MKFRILLHLAAAVACASAALAGDSVVVVNEVHYQPLNPALEYVELHNQLSVNVDLSGWRFDGGITFDFPEGTVMPARGYLVVAKDPTALQTATGCAGVLGPFTGSLDNKGETLKLWNNNTSLRTLPAPTAPPAAGELWSVDIQGDGVGGVYGQVAPTLMNGAESASGLGNVWNALTIASHPATTADPEINLMDSSGALSPLSFAISGTVSGFTASANGGSAPLYNDYLFLNAGSSASNITWSLAGTDPAKTYSMWLYGSAYRSIRIMVDRNGNGSLADDTPVTAPANGGILISGIVPQADGRIIGNADTPDGEVNWSGFQLMIPAEGGTPSFDPGTYNSSLDRRRLMDELTYQVSGPWPVGPAGSGFTLAKIDPQGGGQRENWSTSAQVDGTPGARNFPHPDTSEPLQIALNEISGSNDANFQIELVNFGAESIALDGLLLMSGGSGATYTFPASTLASGSYLVLDETTLGFRPAADSPLFLRTTSQMMDAARVAIIPKARQFPGSGRWLHPDAPTFGAANTFAIPDAIVINEIFHSAFDNSDEEWVELNNRSGETVDLTGWQFTDGIRYSFPAGTSIAAGQFLVVAKDSAALLVKYPGRAIIGDFSSKLGDDDSFVLTDTNGNPADEVTYFSEAPWPLDTDRGGASLELQDADADNARPEAWQASATAQAGSWETITYRGEATDDGIGNDAFNDFMLGLLSRGEVMIDDLSVREDPDGTNIEFIENGTFDSDAIGSVPAGWRCLGNHGQGRSIVVADPDDPSNQCLRVVATGPTEDKSNRIETTFTGSRHVVVGRTYQVSFRARWLSGSNQVNTRLYFNYLQRTSLLDVGNQWGTPGIENSTAVANLGPTAGELAHQPVVPDAAEMVEVSVKLADPQGVASASLNYRIDSGAWQSIPMTLGDHGIHRASVPGQASGALVQFAVNSTDSLGAEARFPAGGAFWRVSANDADTSGLRGNLRLLVSPEDEALLFTATNRMSNDTVPATVIEDERTVYYGCQVRLKGSAFGRYHISETGYNIDFPADQLFRGVHASVSIERSATLKEIIAKHLLNRAGGGYWSQFDDVAEVIGPGATGIGLIASSRTTNTFLKSLFPELPVGSLFNHELLYQPNGTVDGDPRSLKLNNPYNHDRGSYDLADRGADPEAYRWGWQLRNQRRGDDYSSIVRLNRAFALSGSAFTSEIEATIDVDQWMRTWAIMGLYGNDDQYGRLYAHNWRLYQRPTDDRLIALPWDLDRAFNLAANAPLTPTSFNIRDLFEVPAYRRAFDQHVLDLVRTTFNTTYLTSWVNHLGMVTGQSAQFAGTDSYLGSRGNFALTTLPPSVAFSITTNDGENFTTSADSTELAGTGWSDVDTITMDGTTAPLALTWTGPTSWTATVSLAAGVNAITLTARDPRGVTVGADSISITSTGNTVPASAANIVVSELHYHPANPSAAEAAAGFTNDRDFEFIELQNISSSQNVNLINASFTAGIDFTFGEPTIIPPGERIVLARRAAAFAMRHPGVAAVGEYFISSDPTGNQLSNSGETVTLADAGNVPIKSFTYDDDPPWPAAADGDGRSLVLIAPLGNPDHTDPLSWRASFVGGGNPGASDSVPFTGNPTADANHNGLADLVDYAIGGGAPPAFVRNSDGGLDLTIERDLAAEATLAVEWSADLTAGSWQPVTGGALISRTAATGTLERLIHAIPPPAGKQSLFLRVRVTGH